MHWIGEIASSMTFRPLILAVRLTGGRVVAGAIAAAAPAWRATGCHLHILVTALALFR